MPAPTRNGLAAVLPCLLVVLAAVCVSGATTEVATRSGGGAKPYKFAYVMMHYEGTKHDNDYLIGLRVLIYSLKKTGTRHDIVVLLSKNCKMETEKILKADGVIVKRVDNILNPYETDASRRQKWDPRFVYVMNKLYIWDMTEYKRIVYMDTDNLVLHNPDSMFYCGKWCVVYFNLANFHTGFMVVEPDAEVFKTMVEDLKTIHSYDGGDQGFLTQFATKKKLDYELPVFVDERRHAAQAEGEPLPAPFMVIPINLNLHALYVYEHLSYRLWQRGEYKKHTIPGMTYAMTSPSYLKPWYWYPHLCLPDSHHPWMWVRREMELAEGVDIHDFWLSSLILRLMLMLAGLGALLVTLQKKLLALPAAPLAPVLAIHSSSTGPAPSALVAIARATLCYAGQLFSACCVVYWTIPLCTPVYYALPLALLLHWLVGMAYVMAVQIYLGRMSVLPAQVAKYQLTVTGNVLLVPVLWYPGIITFHVAGKFFSGLATLGWMVYRAVGQYEFMEAYFKHRDARNKE